MKSKILISAVRKARTIRARSRTGVGFGQSVRLVCPAGKAAKPKHKPSIESLDTIPVPATVRPYKLWLQKSVLF